MSAADTLSSLLRRCASAAPCAGLNFHVVSVADAWLSIELRAGTHLADEESCRRLVAGAMDLVLNG